MEKITLPLRFLSLLIALLLGNITFAANIDAFEGSYAGEAEFVLNGKTERRGMSTTIQSTKEGFILSWTSVSYGEQEQPKSKTYTIKFVPSDRENIYKSAMKKSLFGKEVPLDPLKGEPFVWARFENETMSVFSLFINAVGEYEMQEFHRTLVDTGLDLVFRRVHKGIVEKEIRATLVRE